MKTINLLFFSTILLACDDSPVNIESDNTHANTYLPLQIGNSWIFESTNKDLNDSHYFKRVTATVDLNDHTYYEIISGWGTAVENILDTAYYRVDDNGFVYILRRANNSEENRFRLYGQDGDAWSYPLDNYGEANVSLSITTLYIGIKKLKACKAYYLDVAGMADEEYTITLASGIGFVKEYSDAWGQGSILMKATINGREINF